MIVIIIMIKFKKRIVESLVRYEKKNQRYEIIVRTKSVEAGAGCSVQYAGIP